MKQVATLLVAAAVLAVPQAAAKTGPPAQLLGLVGTGHGVSVVKLGALTLKPISKAAPAGTADVTFVGRFGVRGAFSTASAALRFLDLDRMRWESRVAYPGRPAAVVWNYADKLVTLNQSSTADVIVVDPIKRRLRAFRPLGGSLAAYAVAGDRIVAVIAPIDGIGATKLAVVDDTGRVRTTPLPIIRAGSESLDNGSTFRFARPALAADRTRAVVISAEGSVVDVSLDSLRVTTHALMQRSLATVRKNATGSERSARWIDTNTIALTGSDWRPDNGKERSTPAGLTLIDARDWSGRKVDDDTSGLAPNAFGAGCIVCSGPLLAYGSNGLAGYNTDGTLRFRLFAGKAVRPDCVAVSYAYISDQNATHFTIVDTSTGNIVTTVATRTSTFLAQLDYY